MRFVPDSACTVYSYGIPQDEATRTNGPAADQDIAVGSFAPVSSDFTYAFPPYSLTLFTFAPAGPPVLGIYLTATNTVVVQWPSPSAGWTLQENTDLTTPNWVAASDPTNDDGTNRFIVVDPPRGNLFFRLTNP